MPALWPFKARNGNGSDTEGKTSFPAGDPCPDFLYVGAQKGGTSWLSRQLEAHSDFWMPPIKELHYLDQLSRTKRFHAPRCWDEPDSSFLEEMKGLTGRFYLDLDSYGRLFQHKGRRVSGDISPTYSTLSDEIIERVMNQFPNLKVIFLARDECPSTTATTLVRGMISPFDSTDAEEVLQNLLNSGVLTRSHPSTIVARWKRYVHPEQFRVYFFDHLKENPAELRQSIMLFLGGDPDKPSEGLSPNESSDAEREKLRLTPKVRGRMAKFFDQELKACARELGRACETLAGAIRFFITHLFLGIGRLLRSLSRVRLAYVSSPLSFRC